MCVLCTAIMKHLLFIAALALALSASAQTTSTTMNELTLTQEWDKTFPQSDKVMHEKVTFKTNYGFTLAADLYIPKDKSGKLPAIAVSGPYGAVKEQVSGRYAQVMAERGFITLAFDPSFTGESSGEPRRTSSPDINTEDFMAAVDYLSTRPDVDADRIGIIGVCGWGGIGLNAACIDTRIKATCAVTMYDMTRIAGNGYNDADDNEAARFAAREACSKQRSLDAKNGSYAMGGGVVKDATGMPDFVQDYSSYYTTERGYHPRSGGSNDGWRVTGQQAYLNARFLHYVNEIRSAVLIVHGEKAHSRYFSETAYQNMMNGNPCPDNKELYIVPGAVHCDLYDGGMPRSCGNDKVIPWDKITEFFNKYLTK